MSNSEIIDKAADLIEVQGWWQDNGGDVGGHPLCASNAISAARPSRDAVGVRQMLAAQRAFWEHLGGSGLEDIWAWNDAQTDAAVVVGTLRAAALVESARELQESAWATYAGQVVTA